MEERTKGTKSTAEIQQAPDQRLGLSLAPHSLHVHPVHQELVCRLRQLFYGLGRQSQVAETLPSVRYDVVQPVLLWNKDTLNLE
jgi:hypothetical protein